MQEDTNSTLALAEYLEIALRRKWLIIIPLLVIIPIAIALCFVLPKIYKAETTILVIPQNIPDSFVKSTVTMNPSEHLSVISQEITSRTNLEKVIRKISPELFNKVGIDQIIAQMRSNIAIDVQQNRSSRTASVSAFTISYQGKDPYQVAETTNLMAKLFIDENLRRREEQAKKTTAFLVNELKELEATLAEQEKVISDYKQLHIGSLPEQRDTNLRMLDQLMIQSQRIGVELNEAENRRIVLQQQAMQSDSIPSSAGEEQRVPSSGSLQARINDTQRRIAELKNKYTDQHPDIVAAQSELQKLTALAAGLKTDTSNPSFSPFTSEIDKELLSLNLTIRTLRNEDGAIKAKIAEYQARVERAPKLEQELFALSRDYQNTKKAYDELLSKRLAAEQAEKLEMDQQGEQFKIIDQAKVPIKPFKPDPFKIVLVGIMLALASGGGLVFLAELLDKSFYSVKDLESYLGLPILASIPLASQRKPAR